MTDDKIISESSEQSMLFYCRDCQRIVVDPKKKGDKYIYLCPFCKGERVAFGTKNAICDFFNIKESMLGKMLDNQSKK